MCRVYSFFLSTDNNNNESSDEYVFLVFVECHRINDHLLVLQAQPPNQICPTSYWNSTIKVVAGFFNRSSTSLTRLKNPQDVTFDGYRYMYVADYYNNRVLRYNPGTISMLRKTFKISESFVGSTQSSMGTIVAGYTNAGGNSPNQLRGPTAIYLDLNRTLYIVDNLNFRVQRWIQGQPIGSTVAGGFGNGTALHKFSNVRGIYVDNQSRIYLCDYGNHRVTRWDNVTTGVMVLTLNQLFSIDIEKLCLFSL